MTTASLTLCLAALCGAVEVDVRQLNGRIVSGRLVGLATDEVVVETAEGEQRLSARTLFGLQPFLVNPAGEEPLEDALVVECVDGSRLHASSFQVEASRAVIDLANGEKVRAATRSIRSVLLKRQTGDLKKQWADILASPRSADVVVLRKTSRTTNANGIEQLAAGLDSVEGVIYDVTPESVGFDFDGTRIDIPREKVEGLLYYHRSGSQPSEPACAVVDATGTTWNLKSVQLENQTLTGVSAGGVRVSVPLSLLASIDFSIGNLVFLSDLDPEDEKWVPKVPSKLPNASKLYRLWRDEAFLGGPLVLNGQTYRKGVSICSQMTVQYRLSREFQRFAATIGIDDRYRLAGRARLSILGDGRQLFSQHISGDESPIDVDIDLRGVRRLSFVVDYGDDGNDIGDHVNFCNARLVK